MRELRTKTVKTPNEAQKIIDAIHTLDFEEWGVEITGGWEKREGGGITYDEGQIVFGFAAARIEKSEATGNYQVFAHDKTLDRFVAAFPCHSDCEIRINYKVRP